MGLTDRMRLFAIGQNRLCRSSKYACICFLDLLIGNQTFSVRLPVRFRQPTLTGYTGNPFYIFRFLTVFNKGTSVYESTLFVIQPNMNRSKSFALVSTHPGLENHTHFFTIASQKVEISCYCAVLHPVEFQIAARRSLILGGRWTTRSTWYWL